MTHVPWHPEDIEYESENEIEEIHGIDSVELLSVGIDIGTTTTHLLFSRILARRRGSGYSSNFDVVEREQIYESPVMLTPYEDETTIDTGAIDAFIRENYEEAGVTPGDVDTGAVIVTGEASRKENAAAITNLFSEQFGKFVCATAGPDLEALMSAHGSGAVDRSVKDGIDVLHIDIGGGTTKYSYIVEGFVEETASLNVGAHFVEFAA
jgi:ethanolamine utilization protein EutA